jgi:small lipoprotein (TIGR04452 family)
MIGFQYKDCISLLIILVVFTHCPILNKVGLQKISRVKGTEAKQILRERLSSFYIKDISDGNAEALAGDFLTPTLARIEDDGIYRRRDVENCASKIFLAALAIDEPNISYNRTKKRTDPLKPSDPNSRILPPVLCSIPNLSGEWVDLD